MSKIPKELELAIKARERKKQSKIDKLFTEYGMETTQEIRDRLQREQDEAYEAISLETKQKFLDLMWAGKNVGEASREVGIDSTIGAQIILRNAPKIFPTKAIE